MSKTVDKPWPFDQPPNGVAITMQSIFLEDAPILLASHDADDHSWQFLDGQATDPSKAAMISMEEVVKHDPSVLEIADLPVGWVAWRVNADAPWQRAPQTDQ